MSAQLQTYNQQDSDFSPLKQSLFSFSFVTPVNQNHPWFGLILRVCGRADDSHVHVQRIETTGYMLTLHVDDVVVVEEQTATGIARSLAKRLILKKSSGTRSRMHAN